MNEGGNQKSEKMSLKGGGYKNWEGVGSVNPTPSQFQSKFKLPRLQSKLKARANPDSFKGPGH